MRASGSIRKEKGEELFPLDDPVAVDRGNPSISRSSPLPLLLRMDRERMPVEGPSARDQGRLFLLLGGQGRLGTGKKGPVPLEQNRLQVGSVEAGPKVLEGLRGTHSFRGKG